MAKKVFPATVFNPNYKLFIIHVVTLNISSDISDKVYLSQWAQIAYL